MLQPPGPELRPERVVLALDSAHLRLSSLIIVSSRPRVTSEFGDSYFPPPCGTKPGFVLTAS